MQTSFSLGGYTLQNIEVINNSDIEGFNADLYKGDRLVAKAYNHVNGDGTIAEFPKENDSLRGMVWVDMQNLLTKLKPVLDKDALWEFFAESPESSAAGFVKLLLDLKVVTEVYERARKNTPDGLYYSVLVFGRSWFSRSGFTNPFTVVPLYAGDLTAYRGVKRMLKYAEKNKAAYGELRAGAVLIGDMDWNLTFDHYLAFFQPRV